MKVVHTVHNIATILSKMFAIIKCEKFSQNRTFVFLHTYTDETEAKKIAFHYAIQDMADCNEFTMVNVQKESNVVIENSICSYNTANHTFIVARLPSPDIFRIDDKSDVVNKMMQMWWNCEEDEEDEEDTDIDDSYVVDKQIKK